MIRKFKARTMKDAMKMAKDFFGDDALVLSSRKVKEPSLAHTDDDEMVEITVTADKPAATEKRIAQPKSKPFYSPDAAKKTMVKAATQRPGNGSAIEVQAIARKQDHVVAIVEEQQSGQEELRRELSSLKETIDVLREDIRRSNLTLLPEVQRFLVRDRGIEPELANELVQNIFLRLEGTDIKDEARIHDALQAEISRLINVSDKPELSVGRPKLICMVGPTGMGKTTTIIKLATHPEFFGRKRVALVTIDTYRVAAAAQLKTFAALAKVPLEIVYEPGDFAASLERLKDFEVILIDTAGRSPLNEQHLHDLQQFFAIAVPDELHLTLSISMRSDVMLDAFENFKSLRPSHLLISKIDETLRLGNILNLTRKIDLPLSFLTNGQKVPDDILLADSSEIAHFIVP